MHQIVDDKIQSLCLEGHQDSVCGVAFNCTGEYLATIDMNGMIKVWNTADGHLVKTLEGPEEAEWIRWHNKVGYKSEWWLIEQCVICIREWLLYLELVITIRQTSSCTMFCLWMIRSWVAIQRMWLVVTSIHLVRYMKNRLIMNSFWLVDH